MLKLVILFNFLESLYFGFVTCGFVLRKIVAVLGINKAI